MSLRSLDPRWADRAPTMRVLDPLGVESTEASLQDRLLRPVLSIAITQRLRYLSYWAWVTANLDEHDADERALFEKVLLVASTGHECPSAGTGTNGIMGGTDDLEDQLADPAVDDIDISAEAMQIAGSDTARFDSYYSGVLYRLLLFENEWTLTPLGEALANAYEVAVPVTFEAVEQAVKQETVPRKLLDQMMAGGCLCQLSSKEQELLTQAYWYLVTPTDHFDELAFGREPGPDLLTLREYLESPADSAEGHDAIIEATIAGASEVDDAEYSEDLDLFFTTGRDAFVRSSLVLLLSIGDWVNRRHTPTPAFEALADAREAWRLLVHAEFASYALQSLFIAILEAIKQLEPIAPEQLLQQLFTTGKFDQAAGDALAGLSLTERSADDRTTLTGVRDAVYFGEAPTAPLQTTVPGEAAPIDTTWGGVCARLQDTDSETDPFTFSGHSERAYQRLLDATLSEPRSLEKSQRVAAYSAIQLARLTTRYTQYYSTDTMAPFTNWFQTAQDEPSAATCWRLSSAHEEQAQIEIDPEDTGAASPFALTAASLTRHWVLDHYFQRLYGKIKDGNGKSPQLLQVEQDGRLTFDHGINDGNVYNGGVPNAPTLKFDRLGDICYELGLIEDNDLYDMQVTDRGRQFTAAFTSEEDT